MMQRIRDRTHGLIAGIIISLLILSFALWGIHSYLTGAGPNDTLATVNGIEITKAQFSSIYDRLRRQLQTQTKAQQSFNEANLKQRTLQELISIEVLKNASIKAGYRISSDQIDNLLRNMPEFQVKGEFSMDRFEQALNAAAYTPAEFIDLMNTRLLIDQPRLGIILSSFALPNEVTLATALIEQNRNIRYLIIPQTYLSSEPITISDQQVQSYYQANKDNFKTPEQVSVEYILLSSQSLAKSLHPTNEMLQKYYNDNINAFSGPAKSKAQAGFAAVKDKVLASYLHQQSEEKFAELKEKLANITYEHPETLQTAAKQLNLPIQVTGLFSQDKGLITDISANPKVREAAFNNEVLNMNNNSDVITIDPSTILVLRVKAHMPASFLSLEAVREQIVNQLRNDENQKRIGAVADNIKTNLETGNFTSEQIAQKFNLHWTDAGFIGRHSDKVDSSILEAAFSMPKNKEKKVSYIITKVVNGYAVIGLLGVKEGVVAKQSQNYQAFAEQVQNSEGLLEYNLYKDSLIDHAKIVVDSN